MAVGRVDEVMFASVDILVRNGIAPDPFGHSDEETARGLGLEEGFRFLPGD